jgi:hypothetical protein
MTSETIFCYHCARHHPRGEMRQIETKGGRKWRCIKSIEATKRDVAQRDAFGQTVTAINRAETQARIKAREKLERAIASE